jgi:hypothetical protein
VRYSQQLSNQIYHTGLFDDIIISDSLFSSIYNIENLRQKLFPPKPTQNFVHKNIISSKPNIH